MLSKHRILLDPAVPSDGGTPPAPAAPDPAPAPEPTPEPAPEPAPPPAPDPLLAALFDDMREPEITPVPDPQPVPAPAAPAAPAPAAAPPTPPAPARKQARKMVVDASVLDEPVAAPGASPAPARAPELAADPDEDYVRGLTDEQKDRLTEAEVAGRLYPDKYGQQRKKMIAWYRSLDSTLTTLTAADPDRTLDENDEEFKQFLKTKPKLEPTARDRVQRTIGAEEAEQKVMARMTPQLNALENRQKEIEIRPKVEELVRQVGGGVLSLIASDAKSPMAAAAKAFQEKGDGADAEHPLEAEIIRAESQKLATLVTEYSHIAKGVSRFDPQNAYHTGLLNFINEEGAAFARKGGESRVRGGKTFLPRDEFIPLSRSNPAEASKHWTFGHDDVIRMLAWKAKESMESRLKAEEELAIRRGFTRKPRADSAAAPKADASEPQPLTPPAAAPIPARGGAPTPVAAQPTNEIDVVETLGFRKF